MKNKRLISYIFLLLGCISCMSQPAEKKQKEAPRIINIINFIRQTDYRVEDSDRLMFEAVQEQIKLINKYDFSATFLLQYDALINPLYQDLLKGELKPSSEIGAWWEITQPHVEAAGIKWRGEHSWVSHANIAFTTGYTPEEREKLVDVYMNEFKKIFGKFPSSVGSWYIDSYTLSYMYEKYQITASCNCKDQIGTDGYTLWGGYWNQAYYPSKTNAYMPAQTAEGQIPVPIFRMLGSDPIYQYDQGLGGRRQGVISLEPVYKDSGADREWVKYFMESLVNQPCLAFNYAQAGQENSFTWPVMQKGLEMQFPILDSLQKINKIRIETLGQSGVWFKENFKVTPPTAVTTLSDIRNEGRKSVWFNSRFYRTNLIWEGKSFRFRDIHIFDETFESLYFKKPGEGSQFLYFTLPIVDGFMWSTPEERAGLRIMKIDKQGITKEVQMKSPVVTEKSKEVLQVECKDDENNSFQFTFYEDCIEVSCQPANVDFLWLLELKTAPEVELPFLAIENDRIDAQFSGFDYSLILKAGLVKKTDQSQGVVFQFEPSNQKIIMDCKNKK